MCGSEVGAPVRYNVQKGKTFEALDVPLDGVIPSKERPPQGKRRWNDHLLRLGWSEAGSAAGFVPETVRCPTRLPSGVVVSTALHAMGRETA